MRYSNRCFLLELRIQSIPFAFVVVMIAIAMVTPSLAFSSAHDDRNSGLSAVTETIHNLRRVSAPENSPKVPPEARMLIRRLKHELRGVIYAALNGEFGQWDNIRDLQDLLQRELNSHGIHIGYPDNTTTTNGGGNQTQFAYGNIYKIGLERPAIGTQLVAATVAIAVPCGEDTSLYLFRKEAARWVPLFVYEADDYDTIISAPSAFAYLILEKKNSNGMFVVTVNINPWCNSFWQQIRYAVYDIAADGTAKIILGKQEAVYLGKVRENETPYRLAATADGFSLAFHGGRFTEKVSPVIISVFKHYTIKNGVISEGQ